MKHFTHTTEKNKTDLCLTSCFQSGNENKWSREEKEP